jgi:hypothetical protein
MANPSSMACSKTSRKVTGHITGHIQDAHAWIVDLVGWSNKCPDAALGAEVREELARMLREMRRKA